jgi:hypothetical protein
MGGGAPAGLAGEIRPSATGAQCGGNVGACAAGKKHRHAPNREMTSDRMRAEFARIAIPEPALDGSLYAMCLP